MLIVVETGSPKGFRFIHSVRERFVKKSREEACIVAPCPHHLACPKACVSKTWCHFSQLVPKYPKRVIVKAPRESAMDNEKFCYLILKKGKTPNVLLKDESKTVTLSEKSFFWPRAILPSIIKQKHVIIDLCATSGLIERRIIGKSSGEEGGYYWARKLHWGDLWEFPPIIPNRFRKEKRRSRRMW